MIFIVEGIDRVGKTTLCEKLKEKFRVNIYKSDCRYNGYNDKKINTERISEAVNFIEQGFIKDIIFDRFHATEHIYGIVDREYSNAEMYDIDIRLGNISDVIYIWVKSSDIERSSNEHGKDLSEHERLFEAFYHLTNIKQKYCIDYNHLDAFVKMLID
jgi:hypothetical protein